MTKEADFIIRPVTMNDLEAMYELASKTGPGMTSLPADKELLRGKIQDSLNSLMIEPTQVGNESYRFVLELLPEKKIIGICAIRARVGGFEPFYSYEIKTKHYRSEALGVDKEIQYLELCKEHDGPSIISSLFVAKEYRHLLLGRFLSRARFLFMAGFPNRVTNKIIAEMRGYIDDQGKSPFWEGTVRHFFDMDFEKADYLSAKDKGFIADLMPKFPLYIPLLPEEVRASIGQLHRETVPAMRFLEAENFTRDNHVDIFDAGPRLSANLNEIKTIKNSQRVIIEKIENLDSETRVLAAKYTGKAADFVASLIKFKELDQGKITIAPDSASILGVKLGDTLIYG